MSRPKDEPMGKRPGAMPAQLALLYREALTAFAAGRLDDSRQLCERILTQRPETGEAWDRLARIADAWGDSTLAMQCYTQAAGFLEAPGEAWSNLSVLQQRAGQKAAALTSLEKARASGFDHPSMWSNLGCALREVGRLGEAVAVLQHAVEKDPQNAFAHTNLGITLSVQGRSAEAVRHLERAVALAPTAAVVHHNMLLCLHQSDLLSPGELAARAIAWGRSVARPAPAPGPRPPRPRLLVGLVSSDFRQHSVKYFLEPLLEHRDRARLELLAFSDVAAPDAVTAELRALCDGWVDCVGASDEQVATRVRAAGVDVLVDLAGHTAGNRLGVFALRAAPVQVTYLGYPGTTGLPTMDFRFVDAWTDPPGRTEAFHSEQLVRLDGGFLCWAPGASTPPASTSAVERNGCVTFGCFNNLAKLSPTWMRLCARTLAAVPGSRLLLKNRSLADGSTRAWLSAALAAHGVPPQRVELREPLAKELDHLAAYGDVDIALDSFPYHGTTTTLEALWMGVPMVSLVGEAHHARVGASLLAQVGLSELAAESEEAFTAAAQALALDVPRLRALHSTLRGRVEASSLMDGPGRTRAFEAALFEAARLRGVVVQR